MKQAYTITVHRGETLDEYTVFGKRAATQELALRKRLNPGCKVTIKETT
jgi:hypothetical protein